MTDTKEAPPERRAFRDCLLALSPALSRAQSLAAGFLALVRERRGGDLEAWMGEALASGVPEMAVFARGLQADHGAVLAGLSSAWSNGQTEGQVNRLKCVKRQMYGRAGFDLLRARVLART